jgi:hypothetical protein
MERGTETVLGTLAGCGGADSPAAIAPANTRPGGLHGEDAIWQETNCYMDLWIELLYGWGLDPRAALAFTVTQDFEGDHFTFFKYPQADIEQLYGTVVQEMAVYDTLEAHVAEQVGRGHTVLVEVDSYYLPDTRATAYRRGHVKTTIAVDRIDTAAQRLSYYHSVGYYTAEGEDYRGLLRLDPALRDNGDVLFPYAECAKRVRTPLQGRRWRMPWPCRCAGIWAGVRRTTRIALARGVRRSGRQRPGAWRCVLSSLWIQPAAPARRELRDAGPLPDLARRARLSRAGIGDPWRGDDRVGCKVLQFRLARAVARPPRPVRGDTGHAGGRLLGGHRRAAAIVRQHRSGAFLNPLSKEGRHAWRAGPLPAPSPSRGDVSGVHSGQRGQQAVVLALDQLVALA